MIGKGGREEKGNYRQDRFEGRARMNWRPRSFESYKSGAKWRLEAYSKVVAIVNAIKIVFTNSIALSNRIVV